MMAWLRESLVVRDDVPPDCVVIRDGSGHLHVFRLVDGLPAREITDGVIRVDFPWLAALRGARCARSS